jgi:hypothetical protein
VVGLEELQPAPVLLLPRAVDDRLLDLALPLEVRPRDLREGDGNVVLRIRLPSRSLSPANCVEERAPSGSLGLIYGWGHGGPLVERAAAVVLAEA